MLKKTFYVVATLVVILFIALAVALFPAHLQIREIQPSLPSEEEVLISFLQSDLKKQELPVAIHYLKTASQPLADGGVLGHMVVKLEWGDGKQFLIDTGMQPMAAIKFGKPFEMMLGAGATTAFGGVDAQLQKILQRVNGVGFTHLHIDHTQGITALCKAVGGEATVFQTSDQATEQNIHTLEGQDLIAKSDCKKQVLTGNGIQAIPGFPGLFAVAVAGHTPGSTVWLTKVNEKIWLFAGDISVTQKLMHEGKGNGFVYSYMIVPEDTERLIKTRGWLSKLDQREEVSVVVSHDLRAYEAAGIPLWKP